MIANLQTDIRFVKGVGPQKALLLNKLGILTLEDLLLYLPRTYIEREQCCRLSEMQGDNSYKIILRLKNIKQLLFKGGKRQLRAEFTDGKELLHAIWFHYQGWQLTELRKGAIYILEGKLKVFNRQKQMVHPKFTLFQEEEFDLEYPDDEAWSGREILPIYPASAELTQNFLRKIIFQVFSEHQDLIRETIPEYIRSKHSLPGLRESIELIHFPKVREDADTGRKRLIFEELFYHQMMLARVYKKRSTAGEGIPLGVKRNYTTKLKNSLPFSLTTAQKRVLREIVSDMESDRRMNRLLQGDVGSGKTIIALFALLLAIENGYQGVLLVPTEILARQHFQTFSRLLLEQPEIRITLLLGGHRKGTKESLEQITSGASQLIIGTHALLEERVVFKKSGLIVIDEQQRFGVQQRTLLPDKSGKPDILYLTATPIPRSLALTIYGDLDISVIDELPPNRKPVKTILKKGEQKAAIYQKIPGFIKKGNQIYIVCPLISETEKLDLIDAERLHQYLKEVTFPQFEVELIHSRMKSAVKEEVMQRFQKNEINILVSTTVIEVGVDVPNASVMIIEHSERFGLSQLHQLRGRVGRGPDESSCYLIYYEPISQIARERLKTMETTNDGFLIADKDLQLRGPGDFFGTSQSGLPVFRFTDIVRDREILQQARTEARNLVLEDYPLAKPENDVIKERYTTHYQTREELFSY